MRLAILNDWEGKKSAVHTNKDGFLKALQVLRDRDGWETTFFKKGQGGVVEHDCVTLNFSDNPKQAVLDYKSDAILFFCDFSRPIIKEMEECGIPLALAYTGGLFKQFAHVPDIVFVESQSYVDWMKPQGINVVKAFGTNTELFKPYKQKKVWDAIFPATFAGWKRHKLFAESMGDKGLACGWWQPYEMHCVESCFENGTQVLHHQIAESVALLYSMAHTCVITSANDGGSQRTVLEAMSCNIPVIAMTDSDKTTEYIREAGIGSIVDPNPTHIREAVASWKGKEVNTRDFILKNYSEFIYADQLKKGIESIC